MNVKVDRTIVKPKVSIIGEFWAMTTEGDGNYGLQKFLEAEGAECDIQPVTAWILFMIWEQTWDTQQRMVLRGEDKSRKGLAGVNVRKKLAMLWLAKHAIKGIFYGIGHVMGLHDVHLADMDTVAEAAAPFYNNHLRGGEGHMEVGKLILNVAKAKATMTLSVKPFGCMPSAGVSDGVQSIITEKYPQGIFCPIETNGDGAVNVYSRVQMMLFKARLAAQAEYKAELEKNGLTVDELRAYLQQELARLVALLSAPRHGRQHGGQPGAARGRRHQEDPHGQGHRLHQAALAAWCGQGQRQRDRRLERRRAPRPRTSAAGRDVERRHAERIDRQAALAGPPAAGGPRGRQARWCGGCATWSAPSTICSASRSGRTHAARTMRRPAAGRSSSRRRCGSRRR